MGVDDGVKVGVGVGVGVSVGVGDGVKVGVGVGVLVSVGVAVGVAEGVEVAVGVAVGGANTPNAPRVVTANRPAPLAWPGLSTAMRGAQAVAIVVSQIKARRAILPSC